MSYFSQSMVFMLIFVACVSEGDQSLPPGEEKADVLCKTSQIEWRAIGAIELDGGESHAGNFSVVASRTFNQVTTEEIFFTADADAVLEISIESTETLDFFSELQFTLDFREAGKSGASWQPVGELARLTAPNWFSSLEINLKTRIMSFDRVVATNSCEDIKVSQERATLAYPSSFADDATLEFRARPHIKSGLGDLTDTYYYRFSLTQVN